MPRTRTESNRDAKAAEILDTAERHLRAGGYRGFSVAAIARDLGIAQNTIYWYFRSKDHLVVAALRRILEKLIANKPSHDVDLIERVVWFTNQLDFLYQLKAATAERAPTSEVLSDFSDQMTTLLRGMLSNTLSAQVPENDLPKVVESFSATVEGAFVRGLDENERRELFTFVLERLIGSS